MLRVLIVYSILLVVTWLYSAYASGRELAEIRVKQDRAGVPPQYVQVNYINVFYQGLCWPTYWAVLLGQWAFNRSISKPEVKGEQVSASYRKP